MKVTSSQYKDTILILINQFTRVFLIFQSKQVFKSLKVKVK